MFSVVACINAENAEIEPPAARHANFFIRNTGARSGILVCQTKQTVDMAEQSTMPSQDDDTEEVNVNSLHDVVALTTRRFEELLVKQDERQAIQFAIDVSFMKIGHSN